MIAECTVYLLYLWIYRKKKCLTKRDFVDSKLLLCISTSRTLYIFHSTSSAFPYWDPCKWRFVFTHTCKRRACVCLCWVVFRVSAYYYRTGCDYYEATFGVTAPLNISGRSCLDLCSQRSVCVFLRRCGGWTDFVMQKVTWWRLLNTSGLSLIHI